MRAYSREFRILRGSACGLAVPTVARSIAFSPQKCTCRLMVRVDDISASVGSDSFERPANGFGNGVVPAVSLVAEGSLKHVSKMEAATNRVEAKKAVSGQEKD